MIETDGVTGDRHRVVGSLQVLRAANDDLLARSRKIESSTERRRVILGFMDRVVASGALFAGPAERRTIQGIIDYWVASYNSIGRELRGEERQILQNVTLRPYDLDLVRTRVVEANDALLSLSGADCSLARRVLLRLASTPGEAKSQERLFAQAPYFGESPEQILRVIHLLIERGVLHREGDRIALATDALDREWSFLSVPLALRMDLTRAASEWVRRPSDDKLLSARTIAGYEEWLDLFDLSPAERKLLDDSKRHVRVRSHIARFTLIATAFLAGAALVGTQWAYHDIYVPRRTPAILSRIVANKGGAADIRWIVDHHQKLFLPGATLKNLDLRGIDDVTGAGFTNGQLIGIDFYRSKLNSSNFQQATIDSVSFSGASLKAARFDGATLRNVSLLGADLTSAVFDGASFCDSVIFSDADVRDVSFKNVEFPAAAAPVFDHVAWWLIAGFTVRQRAILEKPSKPTDFPALERDLRDFDKNIRMEQDEFVKALWYAERAWTLAVYGGQPALARAAITHAIATLREQKLAPERLARTMANLHDTEGYIMLQFAAAEPAGDRRTALLKEAEQFLSDAVRFDNDGASIFRRAIALYTMGREPEADADMEEALRTRRYVPTHEMHTLIALIDKKLHDQIEAVTTSGQTPKEPAACKEKS